MAICQNIIGVSLAKLLNIKPLLGLTAGSMSMEGGHGNAAAYGKTLQDMGVDSAVAAALAAATLGLVFGGLIGGPIVKYLIKRYDLKPEHRDDSFKIMVSLNTINHYIQNINLFKSFYTIFYTRILHGIRNIYWQYFYRFNRS